MLTVLKYLVVDDQEIDRLAIVSLASEFPFLHKIASCDHPVEAFEFIKRFSPDIVFADIEMPDINGVEMIRNLAGSVPAPVFVTSHPEFAIEGFELQAFDYLTKPVSKERFAKCVHRILDFFQLRKKAYVFEQETESGFITIKEGYDKYKIQMRDILYLEAMKDYTRVMTVSRQYLVLGTLSGWQEKLPAENFVRIHRGYIVNCKRITATKGNKILISDHELPIGKLYRKALGELL